MSDDSFSSSSSSVPELPLRPIPGSYGLPVLGPFKDRLDYFWFQGPDAFFRKRMQKHNSTVYRANIPPAFPFFLGVNPNMVVVLDVRSFSYLFDMSLVEKKNVLVGDYMPSLSFTGNIRVLPYLDTAEPLHASAKRFVIDTLTQSAQLWVQEFVKEADAMFDTIEEKVSSHGKSSFIAPLQKCLFTFLTKSIIRADPAARPRVGRWGPAMINSWLALQLIPTQKIPVIPQPLVEIFLHSFPFPAILTKWAYNSLYDFVESEGKHMVGRAMKNYNLTKSEAIHSLIFVLGFNAFGGFSVFLPRLLSTIGSASSELKERLKNEVRKKMDDVLNFETVRDMELVKSVVYEILRLHPPVELQYARARQDFVLSSHDSTFEIKKGELLCGYQTLAMRDPKVFERAEEFVPERFMGENGKKLLNYLFWSNGPQTGTPAVGNKQCPAKDYVVETSFLLVAAIFKRYDEFVVDEKLGLVTKLKRSSTSATRDN